MANDDFLYGIALLSIIPVRKEPKEQSEMVTQLLFGDTFEILERNGAWLCISNSYDAYKGWISENMVAYLTKSEFEKIKNGKSAVVASSFATVCEVGKFPMRIVQGSSLPNYNEEKQAFEIGERIFHFEEEIVLHEKNLREQILRFAKMYLNVPYLWGGKSPLGIDCSGFSQQLAKLVGISLPRDASQQIEIGVDVGFLSQAQAGDLAFFDNEEGRITHVGILLGNDEIIHASGKVRIDRIDQQGIFNQEKQKYTHQLRAIRNIIALER